MVERIAKAIESAEFGWRMSLTRLVDGVSTYTLWIEGEEPREFPATDELYEYLGERKRAAQARSVLEAMREFVPIVRDHQGFPAHQIIGAPKDVWLMLIDAALAEIPTTQQGGNRNP